MIAHTMGAGRRGIKDTLSFLETTYKWNSSKEDVKLFVNSCIQCLSTTEGSRAPRFLWTGATWSLT